MKGISLNITARIIVVICQLLCIKLYTTSVTPSELGYYFFLISLSYSINSLIFIPLDYFQQANIRKNNKTPSNLKSLMILNKKICAIYLAAAVMLILISTFIFNSHTNKLIIILALAYILYVTQCLRNTLNNLQHQKEMSLSFIIESTSKIIIFSMFISYVKPTAETILYTWILSLVLTTFYLYRSAKKIGLFIKWDAQPAENVAIKDVAIFAYPLALSAFFNWIQLQGYRIILVPLGYSEAVGIFGTISAIGSSAVGAISLIYTQQFSPKIYHTKGKYTLTYIKGAIVAIFCVAVTLALTGKFITTLLTTNTLVEHWELILYGVFIDGITMLIGAFSIHCTLQNQTKLIILPTLAGVISGVSLFTIFYLLDFITTHTIGIPLIITQFLIFMYLSILLKKSLKRNCYD